MVRVSLFDNLCNVHLPSYFVDSSYNCNLLSSEWAQITNVKIVTSNTFPYLECDWRVLWLNLMSRIDILVVGYIFPSRVIHILSDIYYTLTRYLRLTKILDRILWACLLHSEKMYIVIYIMYFIYWEWNKLRSLQYFHLKVVEFWKFEIITL